MEPEIKTRILQLVKALDMNPNQFSKQIGKDRSYVTSIKKEISTDVLRNIFDQFPNVNIMWIITGEGDIFIEEESENALLQHYRSENAELKNKVDGLNREIGRLESQLDELKKEIAQPGKDVECADAKLSTSGKA